MFPRSRGFLKDVNFNFPLNLRERRRLLNVKKMLVGCQKMLVECQKDACRMPKDACWMPKRCLLNVKKTCLDSVEMSIFCCRELRDQYKVN